jgi:hypothetical protein
VGGGISNAPVSSQRWFWQPCQVPPKCSKVSNLWENFTAGDHLRFHKSGHLKYYAENSQGSGMKEALIKVAGRFLFTYYIVD